LRRKDLRPIVAVGLESISTAFIAGFRAMSSKKESSLQAFAAVLGILASVVALQDWYGKRTVQTEHASVSASVGIFRLHKPGRGEKGRAAEPVDPAAEAATTAFTAPSAAPTNSASAAPGPSSPASAPAAASAAAATSRPAAAASPAAPSPSSPATASADPFMALVNAPADAHGGVAVAVRGEGVERLLDGLEQQGVRLVRDFFRGGFAQSAYFDQLLAGNGSALHRSGALTGGRVLVGEVQASYRPAEMEVVVCDLSFHYVVLNASGSRVAERTINASGSGTDRATALDLAVATIVTDYRDTLVRAAGG
jgi:hypothetical protein